MTLQYRFIQMHWSGWTEQAKECLSRNCTCNGCSIHDKYGIQNGYLTEVK